LDGQNLYNWGLFLANLAQNLNLMIKGKYKDKHHKKVEKEKGMPLSK